MSENWLNKVRDKMADYEINEPDNLWSSIEQKYKANSSDNRPSKRLMLLMWVKRSVAAAAIIAIAISATLFLTGNKDNNDKELLLSNAAVKTTPIINEVNLTDSPKDEFSTESGSENIVYTDEIRKHHTATAQHIAAVNTDINDSHDIKDGHNATEPTEINTDTITAVGDRSDNEVSKQEKPAIKRSNKEALPLWHNDRLIANAGRKDASNSKFAMSMFTSGATGSQFERHSIGAVAASISPYDPALRDQSMLAIIAYNQGRDIHTDINHRLPVRAGLTFTYAFNNRIGLESGLTYTYLSSEITEGSDSHYYTSEQKLHYIGVPLNLKYRIFSWKRLHFYASAGVLAEKCVSAKLDKDFVVDNKQDGATKINLDKKPMQWSINSSVGLQCNIIKSLGIYVEPGVSYYFDDGTDIQTIYKDKELNFNLNLGIRFTFVN